MQIRDQIPIFYPNSLTHSWNKLQEIVHSLFILALSFNYSSKLSPANVGTSPMTVIIVSYFSILTQPLFRTTLIVMKAFYHNLTSAQINIHISKWSNYDDLNILNSLQTSLFTFFSSQLVSRILFLQLSAQA